MNPHAFFIIGLRESGKELVANLLSHTLGERRGATSSIIYDEVARYRSVSPGGSVAAARGSGGLWYPPAGRARGGAAGGGHSGIDARRSLA